MGQGNLYTHPPHPSPPSFLSFFILFFSLVPKQHDSNNCYILKLLELTERLAKPAQNSEVQKSMVVKIFYIDRELELKVKHPLLLHPHSHHPNH